ncbi:hypothetical protein T439DRAFT_321801 [Meredithblackwellia eburnea MCA 4105]
MNDLDFSSALLATTNKQKEEVSSSTFNASGKYKVAQRGEKEKPKRTARACGACKKKKARCSGEQPCARCTKLKRECVYEQPKITPPKTYAEALEQRLDSMEALLRTISASAGLDIGALLDEIDDDEKTEALERAVDLLRERRKEQGSSPSDQSTADSPEWLKTPPPSGPTAWNEDVGKTRFGCVSYGHQRFAGPSSGTVFAKSILQELIPHQMVRHEPVPSLVDQLLLEEHSSKTKAFPLPEADLSAKLISAYFSQINSLFPILHRPSFERAIQSNLIETDPTFKALVFGVLALGSRFVDDPRIPIHDLVVAKDPDKAGHVKGFQFFQAASGEMASHLVPPSLFDIQGSVLSLLWLMGAASPILAWQRVGAAIRRAVDVGAHFEHRTRWTASPLEDQLRKRAFFSLSAFDRTISAHLGRPLTMQEHESNLTYPLDVSDEELDEWNLRGSASTPPPMSSSPTPMAAWLSLMKLLGITAKTAEHLYSANSHSGNLKDAVGTVSRLDSMLNEWSSTVPDFLRWDPEALDPKWMPASGMLYLTWYHTQILIHRDFFAFKPKGAALIPSGAICSNAARSSAHIYSTLRKRKQLDSLYWMVPQYAITAAFTLTILLIQQGPKGFSNPRSPTAMDTKRCLAGILHFSNSTFMGSRAKHKMTLPRRGFSVETLFDISFLDEGDEKEEKSGESTSSGTPSLDDGGTESQETSPSWKSQDATSPVSPASTSEPSSCDPILALSPLPFEPPPPPFPDITVGPGDQSSFSMSDVAFPDYYSSLLEPFNDSNFFPQAFPTSSAFDAQFGFATNFAGDGASPSNIEGSDWDALSPDAKFKSFAETLRGGGFNF